MKFRIGWSKTSRSAALSNALKHICSEGNDLKKLLISGIDIKNSEQQQSDIVIINWSTEQPELGMTKQQAQNGK